MQIDAHHQWTLSRGDHGWLTSELAPIYRDFRLADLVRRRRFEGLTRR
jgi:L-fuconolactonase